MLVGADGIRVIPVGMYTLYTLTTFSHSGAQGATR
jgi:hypothetical protein